MITKVSDEEALKRRWARQRTICRFIQHYSQEHGWPPSRREIGQAVHMRSLGQVEYWLKVLAQQGYLLITPRVSRGITLTEAGTALAEGRPVARMSRQ